ncbi:MAG: phosphatidate cytidylyltransferase [Nitrosomonadales bacterium]|nr:phosphatidate cytidylyltransferase [Nitrosomonadales bacterium]
MLKQRVITATALLALFLSALFLLPASWWAVLVVVMVLQGTSEWARLSGISGAAAHAYWWSTLAVMAGMAWFDANQAPAQSIMLHLMVYAASVLLWVVVVPAWLIAGWQVRQPLLMALAGWAVLIPTGLAMVDLRAANPWWLLAVMGLVWVADIAAYFAGRKFGKTKLAPSISPGKTWEGVVGALLAVTLYVLPVAWISGLFASYHLLPGLLLASWWWTGLAVIGDLFESAVKRQAGVKDSGELLPGHGGLLDRIDALTSTLPLAALAMTLQKLS